MRAILLISHGSRSPQVKEEILSLVVHLQKQFPQDLVHYAFLEVEAPNIPDGIDQCASKSPNEIMLVLNFVNSGRHVNDDIPAIVALAVKKYPTIKFKISTPIGQHAQIPNLFTDLINNA